MFLGFLDHNASNAILTHAPSSLAHGRQKNLGECYDLAAAVFQFGVWRVGGRVSGMEVGVDNACHA